MAAPESAAALVLALLRPPGVRRVEKTGAARPPGLVDYDTLRRCVNAVRSALIVRASLACGNGDRREAGGGLPGLPETDLQWQSIENDMRSFSLDVVRGATLAASASADSSAATPGSSVDTFTWIFCCLFCACQRIAVSRASRILKKRATLSGNGGGAEQSRLIGTLKKVLLQQVQRFDSPERPMVSFCHHCK